MRSPRRATPASGRRVGRSLRVSPATWSRVLTNKTRAALPNVQAYLEHLGGSDAAFTPTIWNIGTLAPKQAFYATWAVRPMGSKIGAFTASIVVSSDGTDPTRLLVPISIGTRG